MGVNNRQRRAAKQRKRAKSRPGPSPYADHAARESTSEHWPAFDQQAVTEELVLAAIGHVLADPRSAFDQAERLVGRMGLAPVADSLYQRLAIAASAVVRRGWSPTDLGEIVQRRASTGHLPRLAGLLHAETDRHYGDRVAAAWREDLARLGPPDGPRLRTAADVALALGLATVLSVLPPIAPTMPAPGSAPAAARNPSSGTDAKQLARVRALLAKAESTEYAEEAESLSSKAQELISRYALERLLRQADDTSTDDQIGPRRLWIDAPYVAAKAMLINEVASANRCRAVLSEYLGFTTIIGDPGDVEAVEVLTTSLLVQASTAMLQHGRQAGRYGTSRTRSFRQSFLVSYALRIGERLRAATGHAAEATARSDLLLPALRRQEERVEAAYNETFPLVVARRTSISNSQGWAAGRAAADLARLDRLRNLTSEAS